MKKLNIGHLSWVFAILCCCSCNDILTETNQNPNEVDPSVANPNMAMPTIMAPTATSYLDLNWGNLGGVIQHIQHDGWFGGVNHYEWGPENWQSYYDRLRNTSLLINSPSPFHRGVALTIRAFNFGLIADYWGDAPYTQALKATEGVWEPEFDTQETIYKGIIEELKEASALFATGDNSGYLTNYDTYFAGNTHKWHQFANSLLLRYYMRLSEKLPDFARQGVESVYATGVYIKDPADDAAINFVGSNASNGWPYIYHLTADGASSFRRKKPAQPFIDQLKATNDPRLEVWFAPVHVQWVADPTLPTEVDPYIRKNGVILDGVISLTDQQLAEEVAQGNKFTRHFNPALYAANHDGAILDTSLFVGVPVGIRQPDYHNGNPTPGQTVENQHVSQLSNAYRYANRPSLLRAKLIHAAEVAFILAEAAQRGWNVGANAESHYNNAIRLSLQTWEVSDKYDSFIQQPNVTYDGTLKQILTQKWVAAWACGSEAWMDFRRTGLPEFKPGPASPRPVLPVRFIYGDQEAAANRINTEAAIERLESTVHSPQKNSPWAKPWLLQGTGKPW